MTGHDLQKVVATTTTKWKVRSIVVAINQIAGQKFASALICPTMCAEISAPPSHSLPVWSVHVQHHRHGKGDVYG